MEMSRASFVALGSMAFAIYVATHGWPKSHGLADWLMLVAFLAMVWWLLGKRRDAAGDAEAHEQASQSFSFRLGKALNRVRRGFRSRA